LKDILINYIKCEFPKSVIIQEIPISSGNFDYPEIAQAVALEVKSGDFDRGILICGTGIGMSIVANKIEGVRAALCHDTFSATRSIKSNDAKVICMGARVIGPELAKMILSVWLESEGISKTSIPKIHKIQQIEEISFHSTHNKVDIL
jgi:ribose 5-phosphate isomerase B